jgi:hypothetical protein
LSADRREKKMKRPAWTFPIASGILLVALTATLLVNSDRLLAEDVQNPSVMHLTAANQSIDTDLVVVCPQGATTEPQFQNQQTGQIFPISDPRLRAIAEKACQSGVRAAATSSVNIVNNTGKTIYVGFTPQAGSAITWGSGCAATSSNLTVMIANSGACSATVTDSNADPGSRFCAASTLPSTGFLDCSQAQSFNYTIIEPNFQPDCKFGTTTYPSCIFYDISVIPSNCVDSLFNAANQYCNGTGGASYNLPVQLSCSGEPTFTCQGPIYTTGIYAPTGYPSMCGNPSASCIGNTQSCVNAYFSPTNNNPDHQPGAYCFGTLTITFLAGP